MKTFVRLWQSVAEFFLQSEVFRTEFVEKVKTHILYLNLNLLTTTIVAPPSNASKWQMGFNSAFKGLISKQRNRNKTRYHIDISDRN